MVLFIGSYVIPVAAQYAIEQDKTATELSAAIQGRDITISSATLSCKDSMNGTFTADVIFGLDSGIVLSTNYVKDIFSPYDYDNKVENDYSTMSLANSYDSLYFNPMIADWGFYKENRFYSANNCVLQLEFIPLRNELKLDYIFTDALMDHDTIVTRDPYFYANYINCRYATEHSPACACRPYGHILGFFLQGGTEYRDTTNIAVYNMEHKVPVNSYSLTISETILEFDCPLIYTPEREVYWDGPYPQYMRYNTGGSYIPEMNYPGMTVPMQASAPVTPCTPYTLTIGISKLWGLCQLGLCFTGGALFLKNLRAEGLDCDGLSATAPQKPAIGIVAAPNPFKEYIHLVPQPGFQPSTILALQLSDLTGRQLYQQTGSLAQLNQELYTSLRSLPAGTYFLQLQSEELEPQVFKVVKE